MIAYTTVAASLVEYAAENNLCIPQRDDAVKYICGIKERNHYHERYTKYV